MAVRIRLKRIGRRHRSFFRLCAMDQRTPRDGKVLEELGTYDPSVPVVDARAILNQERIRYWLGVGAQPSAKASVLIKKYGPGGTCLDKQKEALARRAQPRAIPDPGPPAKPAGDARAPAAVKDETVAEKPPEAAAEAAPTEAPAGQQQPAAEAVEPDPPAGLQTGD